MGRLIGTLPTRLPMPTARVEITSKERGNAEHAHCHQALHDEITALDVVGLIEDRGHI